MSTTGSLAAALLAALSRPRWWAMALAGFLVRGGLLLVLLPIFRLPTTAGLANELGPVLVGFVLGGVSVGFLVLVGSVVTGLLAWLTAGGLLGGWLDLALVRETAGAEELERMPSRPFGEVGGSGEVGGAGEAREAGEANVSGDAVRAFLARVAAHVPTIVVLVWGAVSLVDAAYQELVRPGDPTLPVPVRVALRIPAVVGLLIAAWAVGEAAGGLAVRHLARGASLPRALTGGFRALFRPSAVVTLVLTNGVLAAAVVGSGTAAGVTWEQLRIVLLDGGTGVEVRLALILFSLTWLAGLWLIALAVTWRATAWTFEAGRRDPTDAVRGPFAGPSVLAP